MKFASGIVVTLYLRIQSICYGHNIPFHGRLAKIIYRFGQVVVSIGRQLSRKRKNPTYSNIVRSPTKGKVILPLSSE